MDKNYNYMRRKLLLPEYGRHIQEMVDSLLDIEDRVERTRQAKAVIAVMGNINPLLRDTADFTHKLWDHLFIMSDFRLDVDSPYSQPSRQDLMVKPEPLAYPQSYIRFKHYGKYVSRMVRALAEHKDADNSESISNICRYMRTKSYEYNQEHPNNDVLIKDIRLMADSDIILNEEQLKNIQSDYKQSQMLHASQGRNGAKRQQRNGKGAVAVKQRTKNVARHNSSK